VLPGSGGIGATYFQTVLGNEISIFYGRDMPPRQDYGFVPILGHGAAVRRTSLIRIKGFPEIVSEDYGAALRLRSGGEYGVYCEWIRSWEAFPRDFGAFITRLKKFSGGCAELFRKELLAFLRSKAVPLAEKFDLCMLLLWYPLAPLWFINLYLSGYVCHRLWTMSSRIPFLHPILPYLFILMFLLSYPIIVSASGNAFSAIRYWFWSLAVHAAAGPIVACDFVLHIWVEPVFARTPKGTGGQTESFYSLGVVLSVLGAATLVLSKIWYSPFSLIMAAYGAAVLLFPLLTNLTYRSWIGSLARLTVWIPGMLFLAGLYFMWTRGSF
jgi:hypothetical protein